jgi:hypothetical protein
LAGVLPEVVPEITRFLEDAATLWVHALEIQLYPLCLRIPYLDGFVPIWRNSFKRLGNTGFLHEVRAVWFIVLVQGVV